MSPIKMILTTILMVAAVQAAASAAGQMKHIKEGTLADDSRIIGGLEVAPNSIPYQVYFRANVAALIYEYLCAGAILDKETIVTSGDCCWVMDDLDIPGITIDVAAGDHDISFDDGSETVIGVSSIRIHESHDIDSYTNNICVVKLKSALTFNSQVAAIKLPNQGQSFTGNAQISGWGSTSIIGVEPTDKLRAVTLPLVSDATCKSEYDILFDMSNILCTGAVTGNVGQPAYFDWGNPVVCNSDVLCGVVSGVPIFTNEMSINTEVATFVDWIENHLEGTDAPETDAPPEVTETTPPKFTTPTPTTAPPRFTTPPPVDTTTDTCWCTCGASAIGVSWTACFGVMLAIGARMMNN